MAWLPRELPTLQVGYLLEVRKMFMRANNRSGNARFRELLALGLAPVLALSALIGTAGPAAATDPACTPVVTTYSEGPHNYKVESINTAGNCTWTVPAGVNSIDLLVVAGGAGGGGGGAADTGRFGGGGGGGGQVVQQLNLTVSPAATFAVQVGAHGAGGSAGVVGTAATYGDAGQPSSFSNGGAVSVTAHGGQGGYFGDNVPGDGGQGGSGKLGGSPGATLGGQGGSDANDGTDSTSVNPGTLNALTGTSVRYGNGGGGAAADTFGSAATEPGSGGRGARGSLDALGGTYTYGYNGGNGTDGIVILRYDAVVSACVENVDYTTSTAGGYTTVTFTNTVLNCAFTVPSGVTSIDYLTVGGGGGGGGGSLYYSEFECTWGAIGASYDKPGGGGAGGAGGKVVSGTQAVAAGDSLNVRVGLGGLSGLKAGCGSIGDPSQRTAAYTTNGAGGAGGDGGTTVRYRNSAQLAIAGGGTGGDGGSNNGDGGAFAGSNPAYGGGANPNTATDCNGFATDGCYGAPGGAGAGADGASVAGASNSCLVGGLSGTTTTIMDANGAPGGAGVTWSVNSTTYGGGGGGRGNGAATKGSSNAGAGGAGGRGAVIIRYKLANDCTDTATATGGGYTYVMIKSGDGCEWSQAGVTQFDYLVVGGGGGGARRHAGGGGAGGMLWGSGIFDSSNKLTVSVGAGGAGAAYGDNSSGNGGAAGSPGQNSSISFVSACSTSAATTITALGGGNGVQAAVAGSGGSGGGSYGYSPSSGSPGSGAPLQGNAGNSGHENPWSGGGGGGAGGIGGTGTASVGGAGGLGAAWLPGEFNSTIATTLGLGDLVSGSDVYFAGGGGGGITPGKAISGTLYLPGGIGGIGGGGAGGAGGDSASGTAALGQDGVANSGGGGGGGGLYDKDGSSPTGATQGGDGGSGVVIIRYKVGDSRIPVCVTPNDKSIVQGVSAAGVSYSIKYFGSPYDGSNEVTLTSAPSIAAICTSGYAASDSVGAHSTIWCSRGQHSSYLFDTARTATATVIAGHFVTFYANGGTGSMDPQSSASTANLTANSFVNGTCAFAGWNTDQYGNGTPYANQASYGFGTDLDLYAQWKCGKSATTSGTTTCSAFAGGTATEISGLTATLAKQGSKTYISGVSVGAVYYWAKVTIRDGQTNGTVFTQNTNAAGLFLAPMGYNYVYDTNCALVKGPKISVASNGSTATLTGATGGRTYYVAVKLGTSGLKGKVWPGYTVLWNFVSGFDAKDVQLSLSRK